jgi:hypothetical protein
MDRSREEEMKTGHYTMDIQTKGTSAMVTVRCSERVYYNVVRVDGDEEWTETRYITSISSFPFIIDTVDTARYEAVLRSLRTEYGIED